MHPQGPMTMRTILVCTLAGIGLLPAVHAARAAGPTPAGSAVEKGVVHYEPTGDQTRIPARYRLTAHSFPYELKLKSILPESGVRVYQLRYPSPVQSPCPENNTVYAEYYRPPSTGPFPATVVLDITGGDQSLSRTIATHLARNGIAALFVQMAYYGPRRPPGSSLRLLSTDVRQTLEAVRQTVLDLRRAAGWLQARPEVERDRLGILGTSLGSLIGSLTAEMEPKYRRVIVLLGGGGLVAAYYDDPRAAPFRWLWELCGGSKEKLLRIVAPADPLTCAANLRDRRLLMIAGKRDDIIPPSATVALWEASGRQKIVWYDCTHYGAALYFVPAMRQVVAHLKAD